jgi:hypothetical protein
VASRVSAEGFFAALISGPMGDAMRIAFLIGALSAMVGAVASYLRGSTRARRRQSISTVASKQLKETRT